MTSASKNHRNRWIQGLSSRRVRNGRTRRGTTAREWSGDLAVDRGASGQGEVELRGLVHALAARVHADDLVLEGRDVALLDREGPGLHRVLDVDDDLLREGEDVERQPVDLHLDGLAVGGEAGGDARGVHVQHDGDGTTAVEGDGQRAVHQLLLEAELLLQLGDLLRELAVLHGQPDALAAQRVVGGLHRLLVLPAGRRDEVEAAAVRVVDPALVAGADADGDVLEVDHGMVPFCDHAHRPGKAKWG